MNQKFIVQSQIQGANLRAGQNTGFSGNFVELWFGAGEVVFGGIGQQDDIVAPNHHLHTCTFSPQHASLVVNSSATLES